MKQLIIPHGVTESTTVALNAMQLCTVYCPATPEPTLVELVGSGDGEHYGRIKSFDKNLGFTTSHDYFCLVFDPGLFEGIMYLKFLIPKPVDVDLIFDIFLKTP